ncbi:Acetyltransferase (isoleucine patch superfamily) [Marivirga sericea]|uniref:Acetyltransferase (Isoleucine patch superfamily) n=1 Tax=Marivirga sericea TaxID=1028 RepID=A0A1X7LGJ2_9BACT|nr:acyltransferase [Marivirga sericea]SMG52988.1 Acetyltransferase (isoleucine patch superfamily) [Marivirga sericea]
MANQLRNHLKFSWKNYLRALKQKRRIGFLGERVFIDKNVELLRFPKNISIESQVVLKEGSRICSCNENAKISIGRNTTVGFHTFIYASEKIEIGNDCLIAPFVYIVDSDHVAAKGKLINLQANVTEAITIGNDVWIGSGAKILKGTIIEDGAIVAAGAVVSGHIKTNEIFGGIPAKKISERK